jgi:predicted TIM-barrel fold metal-dependent hydrolase
MRTYIDVSARVVDPHDEHRLFDLRTEAATAADMTARYAPPPGGPGRCVLAPPIYYQLADGIEDLRAVNDFVLAQRRPDGPVAAVFGVAEPKYGELARREVERLAAAGAKGVVWSARTQGLFADHPLMAELCGHAQGCGLVSMLRTAPYSTNEALWRIWRLAERCGDIPLIVTGALHVYDNAQAVIANCGGPQNIVYDTAGWNVATALDQVLASLGEARLLFGSGGLAPSEEAAVALETFLQRRAQSAAAERILWRNSAALLDLVVEGVA